MKNKHLQNILKVAVLAVAVWWLGSPQVRAVQLTGTYTIDSAGTPSATVFRDFNSAIIYMTSSGTRPDGGPTNSSPFGVSGPVVFQVMQGTYNQQVNIPAITGASSTNTITFDGGNGNAATRILQFSASSTTDAHTLRFSSCSWINVRNLTIRGTSSTAAIAAHFFGANTANIRLSNCSLFTISSTSTSIRTIVVSNSNVSSTVTACGSSSAAGITNIFIDSNYIFGGQNGVQLGGSSNTTGTHNFFVRWNTIEGSTITAIYASSTQGYLIHGNYIKMATGQTTGKGIHHCNGSTSGTQHYVITNNIIENAGQYGIHFQSNNANTSLSFPTVIANNYIKPTFLNASSFGIDLSQARNHKIYNNTIIMNIVNGVGINLGSSAQSPPCAIKNNIIMLRQPNSTNLCIASGAQIVDSVDFNVYIKNNPDPATNLMTLNGSTFNKLNYRGGLNTNFNSSLEDPMLQSDSIPRPGNICQRGQRLWFVTTDLFGDTRPNPPQIGCLEGAGGIPFEASVVDIIEPLSYPVTAGTQTVKVLIKNNGTSNITSMPVSVQLGSVTNTVLYTGNLGTCNIDTVTFSGSNALTLLSGTNIIRAWVALTGDTIRTNDTIQRTFCTPLQTGTYTIDTGIGDFKSFAEVASVLNCGGVIGTGLLEFVVSKGVYTGQLNLTGVRGLGPNTRMLFRSADNNADSVELRFNATSVADNFVVRLGDLSYTTFRDMTFRAMSTSFGRVFEFTGNPLFDSIYNCKLIMQSVATTSNNLTGIFGNPIGGKRNYFCFNLFQGGAFGIQWMGTSATINTDSNLFNNNRFVSQYYSAIWTSFNYNAKMMFNDVTPNTGLTSFYGFYVINSNFVEVANNKITPWNGGYGYFFSSVNGNATIPCRVYNNTLAGGLTGTSYGLYLASCTFMDVYHNTIWLTGTASTSYALYTQLTATTNTSTIIRNNIFANIGSGTANYAAYIWAPNTTNMDYNNLFTNGPNLVQQASPALTYPNIFEWRLASNFDKNSVSYRPGLMSNLSAVPNPNDTSSWINNGRGIFLNPYYQLDLDGNPRPLNRFQGAPDLGAYEFTPTSTPPQATFALNTLAPDSTTRFMFGGDTVATITWPSFGFPPTGGLIVRRYSGVKPPAIDTTLGHMNNYVRVTGPFGSFQYNLRVYYRPEWLGNISNESVVRMARRDTAGFFGWLPYTLGQSSVDTVNRRIFVANMFDMNYDFTGTDDLNPLPVRLSSFKATRNRDNVLVEWTTAQEINSDVFVVERSFDGRSFDPINRVKAAGNSSRSINYVTTDFNPMGTQRSPVVYYRLKMIDRDNSYNYSSTVAVRFDSRSNVILYPNPFINDLAVAIESEINTTAKIEVYDLAGSLVMSKAVEIENGSSKIMLNELDGKQSGIYLINVKLNNNDSWHKLIKE
ncbi:MAG: T9SS type A sorting domain-containing protein [Bacteroidia bacterium]